MLLFSPASSLQRVLGAQGPPGKTFSYCAHNGCVPQYLKRDWAARFSCPGTIYINGPDTTSKVTAQTRPTWREELGGADNSRIDLDSKQYPWISLKFKLMYGYYVSDM